MTKEAELKAFWMPDSVSKECYECGDKFTTFRRRHHCRVCGQIFCSKCRSQELPGKLMGIKGNLKVCIYCSKVAATYMAANPPDLQETVRDIPQESFDTRLTQSESFVSSPDASSTLDRGIRKKSAVGYDLRGRIIRRRSNFVKRCVVLLKQRIE
jgi:1-phosphatidylinositol-3-phosphate 5-kinase